MKLDFLFRPLNTLCVFFVIGLVGYQFIADNFLLIPVYKFYHGKGDPAVFAHWGTPSPGQNDLLFLSGLGRRHHPKD